MANTKRYARLHALNEFGINANFRSLKDKSILVCGVGGIGSLSAEMLTRCGVGLITVIDFDTVSEENLNRIFYKNEHIGISKAIICSEILSAINPDVKIMYYHNDIMDEAFEEKLDHIISHADIVLMGLDNIPARQYINVKCVDLNVPLMDAGALRSGLGCYVHLVLPKITACYQCTGSVHIQRISNDILGQECVASLPSTIGIISSLQVQQVLKFLLNFGKNADFISFSSLSDDFVKLVLPIDPECYVCGSGTEDENLDYTIEIDEPK